MRATIAKSTTESRATRMQQICSNVGAIDGGKREGEAEGRGSSDRLCDGKRTMDEGGKSAVREGELGIGY
jgi:hypothetical protein